MNNLANTYGELGKHAEALKLHEETLALRRVHIGANHPDTLISMSNVAACYVLLGRPAEALKLNRETLEMRKAELGGDHPETVDSMNNLADCYAALDQHAEALALHQETWRCAGRSSAPTTPTRSRAWLAWRHVSPGSTGVRRPCRSSTSAAGAPRGRPSILAWSRK